MSTQDKAGDGDRRSAGGGPGGRSVTQNALSGPRTELITPDADPRMSRSMEYGLAILACFSGERPSLGIADLADMIQARRPTTHRYVTTLVELGYLEQGAKRKYLLAPRAAEAGMVALGALRLSDPARATLEQLRERTGCTVGIGVRDHTRAFYIDRILGHRVGQFEIDAGLGIGVPLPLHCTALGKVLLAGLSDPGRADLLGDLELRRYGPKSIVQRRELEVELERIGRSGLAVSDEELRPGARSIAVPVVDPRLRRPIAIDITVAASAFGVRQLAAELGPELERAAELVAAQ